RGGKDIPHRHARLREDLCDLVHEGDVDVALGVLDGLCSFGHLDGRGTENAAFGDRAIDGGQLLDDFSILAGDHLGDLVDRVLAVARVDALGAIAEAEVASALEARNSLDLGAANVFRYAGIDGAFVDDGRTQIGIDRAGDGARRCHDGGEVGTVHLVDGRRHGHDVDVCAGDVLSPIGQDERRL